MHYEGNLNKAIELIDRKDKSDFIEYLNTETSINLWNLFCCRSPKLLGNWYETVFNWLFNISVHLSTPNEFMYAPSTFWRTLRHSP